MQLYNGVRFPIDEPCPANVRRLDMGCYPLLDDMHRNGILVDKAILADISQRCSDNMARLESEMAGLVGKRHAVNPASPKGVADLLWKKLRIQGDNYVPITDSGNESTDASTLDLYRDVHPVVDNIIEWRQNQKIKTTYADKLPRMADNQGRIHTSFKTTRAATGRLSSANPNLQNIPNTATEMGKLIRSAFIARPGYKLVGRDLSQIEMRVVAHLSQEPTMLEGYHTLGWDMHTQTAMDIFGLPREQIHKEKHRLPAKTCGFGVVYLIGPDGLQAAIAAAGGGVWTLDQCDGLLKSFYAQRPYIASWQQEQFHRCRLYGMVWTLFGRHRIIPQTKSALSYVESAGLREGANQPVQGTAGDILKLSMAIQCDLKYRYNKGLPSNAKRVYALLQVHDELIYEVKEDFADEWGELIRPSMEEEVKLDVPLGSDLAIGDNWMEIA